MRRGFYVFGQPEMWGREVSVAPMTRAGRAWRVIAPLQLDCSCNSLRYLYQNTVIFRIPRFLPISFFLFFLRSTGLSLVSIVNVWVSFFPLILALLCSLQIRQLGDFWGRRDPYYNIKEIRKSYKS